MKDAISEDQSGLGIFWGWRKRDGQNMPFQWATAEKNRRGLEHNITRRKN